MKRPKIRNLIENDGLTQPGRRLEELDPLYAKIDDRSMIDLLALTWQSSDHLHFFEAAEMGAGEQVQSNGSWQQLLRHEPIFYLALISGRSPQPFSRQFESALAKLDPGKDDDDQWADKIFEAFTAVVALCEDVDGWLTFLPRGSQGYRDLRVYAGQLADSLHSLLALYAPLDEIRLWDHVRARLKKNAAIWDIDRTGDGDAEPSAPPRAATVDALRTLFGAMQSVYAAIVNNARQVIATSLEEDTHQAHVGLFLAFLRLLEHNRDHLNALAGRHLDFYLRQVLRLKPKKRTPDAVNLVFEPAKNIVRHKLGAGTAFKGGKNEDKHERLYDLQNELTLSRATVADLKNIHVARSAATPLIRSVHAGAVANSADGQGEALSEDNPKWPGFGTTRYPLAEVGFMLASPLLRLSEGIRKVTLTFKVSGFSAIQSAYADAFRTSSAAAVQLPDLFRARVTTAKGWYDCTPVVSVLPAASALRLFFTFERDVPPIVDYDAEKLAESPALPVDGPLLRLSVNQQDQPAAYDMLCRLRASEMTLHLDVSQVRGLVLENDAARLKADKPFLPFGGQPRIDSAFYIGHAETFAKPLTHLSTVWQWVDPPADLETHYQNYTTEAFQFTAAVDLRENYGWGHSLGSDIALSDPADPESKDAIAAMPPAKLQVLLQAVQGMSSRQREDLKAGVGQVAMPAGFSLTTKEQKAIRQRFRMGRPQSRLDPAAGKGRPPFARDIADARAEAAIATVLGEDGPPPSPFIGEHHFDISGYDVVWDASPFKNFSESLRQGGIRFRLKTPEFAFGHKRYPKLHAEAVAVALESEPSDTSLLKSLQLPYTPMFENLTLSYQAEQVFDLMAPDDGLQMLLVQPFGYAEPEPGFLVTDYPAEGTLYIGLADLAPPQNLSLLIQLAEGSGDPFQQAPREVAWSYLNEAGWVALTPAQILRDGTLGFLQSGIIDLALPKAMRPAKPELPQGLHWLRVTVSDHTGALHDVLAVMAQAGVAVYRDEGHRAAHLATALPAGSVTKMLHRDTAVKSVHQPFASYGGREAESAPEFRVRSSERLRHKDRAVVLWDYEHLILERFPEIHKVKCINHACRESAYSPGHVMLVLIPDLRNRNSRYPLRPAVPQSVLEAVKQFVQQRCSAHVEIHVVNPFYERIAIGGLAHLHPGFDPGIYTQQLHQDITRGLTPWLRGGTDIHFGGRIHSSLILNLIEERPYVDYVTAFTVTHYTGPDDVQGRQVDEVIATRNRSILVSNASHTIQGVLPS